jgi:hypothetical protein
MNLNCLIKNLCFSLLFLILLACAKAPQDEEKAPNTIIADRTPEPPPAKTIAPGPPASRPSTIAQLDVRKAHLNHQLWETELGKRFNHLLEPNLSSEETIQIIHTITDRLFGDPKQEIIRLTALKAMIEDLYEREQFNTKVAEKAILLEIDITQQFLAMTKKPASDASAVLPYLIALSLFGGSPEVQRQLKNFGSGLYDATLILLFKGRIDGFRAIPSTIQPTKIFSRDFFSDYTPKSAIDSFLTIFPPGLTFYYFLINKKQVIEPISITDILLQFGEENIRGLQNL